MSCKGGIAKVGNTIVKTNSYRCIENCPNCPFLDEGKAIGLKSGRVDSIKKKLRENDNESFPCHKTVYDLDNNMNKSKPQRPKMCKGAYDYLKSIKQPNIMMRLALCMGVDEEEDS